MECLLCSIPSLWQQQCAWMVYCGSKLWQQPGCFGRELAIRTGAGTTGVAHLGVGTGRNGSAMCHWYFRGRAGGARPPFEIL